MTDEKRHEDDDEISIDFSGIKKWFSGNKEKEEHKTEKEEKKAEIKTEHHEEAQKTQQHTEHHHEHTEKTHTHQEHKHENQNKAHTETHKAEKEDDDEINIDFSGIKKWFSGDGKKEEHTATSHKHHEEQKTHHDHNKKEEDEISFDFSEIGSMAKKYATVLLILVPIILTIAIRIQPNSLPITDQWARDSVYNYYQGQIAAQIQSQYPNLPEQNMNSLVAAEFQKFQAQNKDGIEQQIAATSQQFKSALQYDSGGTKYTYLGDIDSYYWLRETRKIMKTGLPCDEIEGDTCYNDNYRTAPLRPTVKINEIEHTIHPYMILYTYKILHAFNSNMTLMQASFNVPIILAVIVAIFAFLLGQQLGGNVGGLFTSIIISVNPIFLSRSMGSDTDVYNAVFPILIMYFLVKALKAETTKKSIIFGTVCGLFLGLYNLAWTGWWFIFDFIIITLIGHAIFLIAKENIQKKKLNSIHKNKNLQKDALIAGILTLLALIITTLTNGFDFFTLTYLGPFGFSVSKVAALESLWPNVLVTVAEFNPADLGTIVGQVGGKMLFFLAVLGITLSMVKKEMKKEDYIIITVGAITGLVLISSYGLTAAPMTFMAIFAIPALVGLVILLKSNEEFDARMAILLTIWFIGTTYAALKGIRFTLLMIPAFGTALGVTMSFIYNRATDWITKEMHIKKAITTVAVCAILAIILISPVKAGYSVGTGFIPSVNSAWDATLTKIKDNSQPDAIINSWWDFGHWFKYFADRRVTLDGASQGDPQLHWLGKLITTPDEQHSLGILRMLDCGANTAFEKLNEVIKDTPRSINILDTIIREEDSTKAKKMLTKEGLTTEEADEVLKYTHCNPPENFYITSEDMIGKSGVWAHFGSWNFTRASMYQDAHDKTMTEGTSILTQKYGLSETEAQRYYEEMQTTDDNQWITEWPSYYSGVSGCQKTGNTTYRCEQGTPSGPIMMELNITKDNRPALKMLAREEVEPELIVYPTKEGVETIAGKGKTVNMAIIIIPTDDGYATLLSHPKLGPSIFSRLFFLEGHGLKHFDRFDDTRGITGGRIITWKVDWEGKTANQEYYQKNETKQETTTAKEQTKNIKEEQNTQETTSKNTKTTTQETEETMNETEATTANEQETTT